MTVTCHFFEPFMVEKGPRRGLRPRDHRFVPDGAFWIARTGTAWRDLHSHFGAWNSVYRQFRRWTQAGLWDVILEALNETGTGHDSVQMIDSTIIRAHQHAAVALKKVIRTKVLGALAVASRPRSISAAMLEASRLQLR
jgi:transposase